MSVQTFAQWKSYYPDGTTRKNTKKEQNNNIEKDNNQFKFNTHFYNALSFKSLENFEEALKEFEKCININSGNPVPYYESAIIYKLFAQEESALEFSKKAYLLNKEKYMVSVTLCRTTLNKWAKHKSCYYIQTADKKISW